MRTACANTIAAAVSTSKKDLCIPIFPPFIEEIHARPSNESRFPKALDLAEFACSVEIPNPPGRFPPNRDRERWVYCSGSVQRYFSIDAINHAERRSAWRNERDRVLLRALPMLSVSGSGRGGASAQA